MSVDSLHPEYQTRIDQWERVRDCYEGTDAIKARRTDYLPLISTDQKEDAYNAYLQRASYYPAFARTIEGLVGCVMRHPPVISAPDFLRENLDNIDGLGTSVEEVVEYIVRELLITSRAVVTQDVVDGSVRWHLHPAEDVISWDINPSDRKRFSLDRLVTRTLRYEPVIGDPGEYTPVRRFRVWSRTVEGYAKVEEYFDISDIRNAGGYPVFPGGEYIGGQFIRSRGVFPHATNSSYQKIGEEMLLQPSGEPLMELPVQIIDLIEDPLLRPPKPALMDMADLAISHYRTSADLEHALHFVALPTPWMATKRQPQNMKDYKIGSGTAWWIPEDGKVGILEVSGAGFAGLEQALARKSRQLAAVGARLVDEPTRHAETASAVMMKSGGDRSLLHTVCARAERSIEKLIRTHMMWAGIVGGDPKVRINRDWMDARIGPGDVRELSKMLQNGILTPEGFADALARGEWVRRDHVPEILETIEETQKREEEKEVIDAQKERQETTENETETSEEGEDGSGTPETMENG